MEPGFVQGRSKPAGLIVSLGRTGGDNHKETDMNLDRFSTSQRRALAGLAAATMAVGGGVAGTALVGDDEPAGATPVAQTPVAVEPTDPEDTSELGLDEEADEIAECDDEVDLDDAGDGEALEEEVPEEDGEDEDGQEDAGGAETGEEAVDAYPVTAVLTGSNESEKLQGFESDDTVTGGGGPDLFPFTTGNDVIVDFDPDEDMLDVGDFARAEGRVRGPQEPVGHRRPGPPRWTSMACRRSGSTSTATSGDSTTTVVGATIDDLSEANVFFGARRHVDSRRSSSPTSPRSVVTNADGSTVRYPGHPLSQHPIDGEMVASDG